MVHLNIVFVQSQVATLGKEGGEVQRGRREGREGGREGREGEKKEREREGERRREGGNEF